MYQGMPAAMTGSPPRVEEGERIHQTLTTAQDRLAPEAYATAWQQGRSASIDELLG